MACTPCWNLTHSRGTEKNDGRPRTLQVGGEGVEALGEEDVHAGGQQAVLDQRALGHVRQRQVAQHARALVDRAAPASDPAATDQAKVAKLCITPLGAPVVPEVYMMVAELVAGAHRRRRPAARVRATMSSHCG